MSDYQPERETCPVCGEVAGVLRCIACNRPVHKACVGYFSGESGAVWCEECESASPEMHPEEMAQ